MIYTPSTPRGSPDFQAHHHPFNYYANFDPVAHAAERAAHLKDYNDLVADAAAGTLPAVAFYKPQGNLNQHEGYANLDDGDAHIADLIQQLQASPQWRAHGDRGHLRRVRRRVGSRAAARPATCSAPARAFRR